jgi:hypothetical protein
VGSGVPHSWAKDKKDKKLNRKAIRMDLQWICNGFAMDLQWICNGFAMDFRHFFHKKQVF